RPVPLVEVDIELPDGTIETRNVPNPSRKCGTTLESSCHLWNGGEQLLAQAAEDTELVPGNYNLGPLDDQRRVYYGHDENPGIPRTRRFFAPPTDPATEDALWQNLLESMGICPPGDTACGLDTNNRNEGTAVIDFLHRKKTGDVPQDDPRLEPAPGEYILGDIFHSDPAVLGGPDEFRFWVADVGGPDGDTPPLDDFCDPLTGSPDGYRCYFAEQRNRRKVLLAGANDGQVHAWDAGIFRASCDTNVTTGEEFVVGEFDNGTGNELFSYVPTAAMPVLDDVKDSLRQQFTVDGRVSSGDVFIDPVHGGTPADREWRTVIMGGLREGGSGYYVLDVTHPDTLSECDGTATIPTPEGGATGYVPSCLDNCSGGSGGSDHPYPMPLFEFYDNEDCGTFLPDGRCDDDVNNRPDLADSWSTATIGRIRVLVDDGLGGGPQPEDRYVAVFGGGMDADRKDQLVAGGNYLYMVDIETGKAIYKRELIDPDPLDDVSEARGAGSAASDPAAVDTDQDGYLDTIYIGTTRGYVYKADISEPRELLDLGSLGFKVTDLDWSPFPVFDTDDRPIYHPPAVVFVAQKGQYALAFGTGDREDLWSLEPQEGRLYMILDNDFRRADFLSGSLPRDESGYAALGGIDAEEADRQVDLLRNAPFGWFLTLDPRERVITRTFALGGVTIFSSFQPEETVSEDGTICLRRGSSRVFVVNTTNADSLLESQDRYFRVEGGFLSAPFVETGATTNPEEACSGPNCAGTDAVVPDNLDALMKELRGLLPPQCRFANYTINIKAVRDDTGIEFLAAIPVCTVRTNWRDF
ncbi:MAG: pilus assembly protein, partial [Thermoanaerobaculia bacterium]